MSIWPRDPGENPPITSVLILLDTLTPAERRDLANSLLRAAWGATLEQTRVLLLDALAGIDHGVAGVARLTSGTTFTNVNETLVKARLRIRLSQRSEAACRATRRVTLDRGTASSAARSCRGQVPATSLRGLR